MMLFEKVIFLRETVYDVVSDKCGRFKAGDIITDKERSKWNDAKVVVLGLVKYKNEDELVMTGYNVFSKDILFATEKNYNNKYKTISNLKKVKISKTEKTKLIKEAKEFIENQIARLVINQV